MKATIQRFLSKEAANKFADRLEQLCGRRIYRSVYVLRGHHACTVSGDFTQEQIDQAKEKL
jgi:hypothetical protein